MNDTQKNTNFNERRLDEILKKYVTKEEFAIFKAEFEACTKITRNDMSTMIDHYTDLKSDVSDLTEKVETLQGNFNSLNVSVAKVEVSVQNIADMSKEYRDKMINMDRRIGDGFDRLSELIISKQQKEITDLKKDNGKMPWFARWSERLTKTKNGSTILTISIIVVGILALVTIIKWGEQLIALIPTK